MGATEEGLTPLIVRPTTDADWAEAGRLIREYLGGLPMEVDFQDVDSELAALPTEYGPPGGAALLVQVGPETAVGFVGVRRFSATDAELKRMYLMPAWRGTGLGNRLCEAAIEVARGLGYHRLLLDTVSSLTAAIATYHRFGFEEIAAYRYNPLPDAMYFALDLTRS